MTVSSNYDTSYLHNSILLVFGNDMTVLGIDSFGCASLSLNIKLWCIYGKLTICYYM